MNNSFFVRSKYVNLCLFSVTFLQVSKSKFKKNADASKSLPTHNRLTSEEFAKCGKCKIQKIALN